MESTYRFDQTFEANAAQGPRFNGTLPEVPATPSKRFLGLPVNSRFGLSAGPGINSRWTSLYGQLGFDILTYKTVRGVERIAHPVPNWLFLRAGAPVEDIDAAQCTSDAVPPQPLFAPTAGSIGTPSAPPDFWQSDIGRARAALLPGQVLIVSVMGTAVPGMSQDAFVAEFGRLAAMAREAGAQIIEANLSCPNVVEAEGQTFTDAALSGRIAAALRSGARDLPTLLKVGQFSGDVAPFLRATAPYANGVVMINAPSRRIVDAAGRPAFGAGREQAGVHGFSIHALALDCVRAAKAVIQRERLDLEIVGVGGACTPARIAAFIEAGASATLAASAVLWNPYLAVELKRERPEV